MDRSRYNAVDSSSRQYGERSREYGERSREYGGRSREFGERSGEYGERSGEYGRRSREYGERSGEYGRRSRHYSEPSHEYAEKNNCQQRLAGSSYLFPLVTVMAVVLLAVSTFIYRSVIGAFAADSGSYFVEIFSSEGEYSVTVTGDQSTTIDLSDNEVEKKVNEDSKTVTFTVKLTEERKTTISSDKALSTITFGENASAVKGIYANSSKVASIDISHCKNLETLLIKDTLVKELNIDGLQNLYYINAINTPFATFAKAYALNFARPDGCSISINPPEYRKDDDGIYFNVTDLGNNDDLSLMINGDGNYSSCIEYKDGKYYISNSVLNEAYKNKGSLYLEIRNTQEKLFFAILIDIPDSVITGSDKNTSSNVEEKKADDVNNDTDETPTEEIITVDVPHYDESKSVTGETKPDTEETKPDTGETKPGTEETNPDTGETKPDTGETKPDTGETKPDTGVTRPGTNQVKPVVNEAKSDTDEEDTSEESTFVVPRYDEGTTQTTNSATEVELKVDNNSSDIIMSVKAHSNTKFFVDDVECNAGASLKIVATALSADDKTAFVEQIKKADKSFKEDSNLMIYNVKILDENDKEVKIQGKIDFTLAYPNDSLSKNYSKYNFKVYHQKSGDSIDTNVVAVSGQNGVTVTADSLSAFAVAPKYKSGGNGSPVTGESNASVNFALLLAMLSLMSLTGVYAKNKAKRY